MFATVLWDVYSKNDSRAVHRALIDAASPGDNEGWSSTGIYAFYDPSPRTDGAPLSRLKYVGLAIDLPNRFAQHNGILKCRAGSSKKEQIQDWFEGSEYLGFSAFVQSPLHQAFSANFLRKQGVRDIVADLDFGHDQEARNAISILEGQLIESNVLTTGSLPAWNKMGGSKQGKIRAAEGTGNALLQLMEGSVDNLFVARRSLRQLEEDTSSYFYESSALHTARMNCLMTAVDRPASTPEILQELDKYTHPTSPYFSSLGTYVSRMKDSRYLESTTRTCSPLCDS